MINIKDKIKLGTKRFKIFSTTINSIERLGYASNSLANATRRIVFTHDVDKVILYKLKKNR